MTLLRGKWLENVHQTIIYVVLGSVVIELMFKAYPKNSLLYTTVKIFLCIAMCDKGADAAHQKSIRQCKMVLMNIFIPLSTLL